MKKCFNLILLGSMLIFINSYSFSQTPSVQAGHWNPMEVNKPKTQTQQPSRTNSGASQQNNEPYVYINGTSTTYSACNGGVWSIISSGNNRATQATFDSGNPNVFSTPDFTGYISSDGQFKVTRVNLTGYTFTEGSGTITSTTLSVAVYSKDQNGCAYKWTWVGYR
jgi:hypothetical protein